MGDFNIIVLAKQVPDTRNVGKDAMKADGTVNRSVLPAIFNPEDLNALEQALRIKAKKSNCNVTLLTMGPARAAEIIREGFYRGADDGILLTDRNFAGADTLATSYALSCAIKKIKKYDLIISGRQAIDGDTAQVGPQVAEKLGIPQITYVENILDISKEKIRVKRRLDEGIEVVEAKLPLLITVNGTAPNCRPRNAKNLMKFKHSKTLSEQQNISEDYISLHSERPYLTIKEWGVNDIDCDISMLGLNGSPTKVKAIENVVFKAKEVKRVKAVGLWITEAIPPFAVGIFIVGFLVFFLGDPEINKIDDKNFVNVIDFVNTWSNSVIWLILGGFFLAGAMKKTGLDIEVFKISALRFGSKPSSIILGLMLATAIVSMVMSNTATTAMMLASVAPLLSQLHKKSPFTKALLLGIPASAALGGMGTIIGSPPNAIAVDALNNIKKLDIEIGFLEWMIFGAPIAILLVIITWFALIRKFKPDKEKFDIKVLKNIPENENLDEDIYEKRERILRRRIVIGVLILTVILWLTTNFHPIPAAAVSGIPIIVFTMVGIISAKDVRNLPWDTLMLVAGGLSLGLAIESTGLAQHFVNKIQDFEFSFELLIIIFSLLTVVLSNIMSNTATATILIPMASLFVGVNPIILPVVIGLSASCALFLPVSTPPNAVAFSTGKINQSDFRFGGTIAGILGPIFIIFWTLWIANSLI